MNADQDRWLRRRRIFRGIALCLVLLLVLSVILDHTGAFGSSASDVSRFDRKGVNVIRAIDGDAICVQLPADSREETVHLLGVDAPELPASHWSENAAKYTSAR